ncbi:hypothetical protein GCM10023238_18340 [Streptomyces heliomycini]
MPVNSSRHRHAVLSALAVLITVAGCSSADDSASAAVPRPDAKVTELCQNLDEALRRRWTVRVATIPNPRPN